MGTPKTKKNRASVRKFLHSIADEARKQDCLALLELMQKETGEKPCMWGDSIIGFGSYHYRYASGQEGEWPAAGFSPRKQNISIYVMPGFGPYTALMEKLGTYKTGRSCLYVRRLGDVHLPSLKKLIKRSYADIKKLYYPDKGRT